MRSESMSERGAALVTALLAMLLITVLAVALISTGTVSGSISTNGRQQTEAFYISEAGLTHGARLIDQVVPTLTNYTAVLQAGDGAAGTWDELSTQPTALTAIPSAGITFGAGRYRLRVNDDPADTDGNPNVDSNRRLMITSLGIGADGSTATTEAVLASTTMPAILVNWNLAISGNPSVSGAGGTVHANGSVLVSGNPCVSQSLDSTSTVTIGGTLQTGPSCGATGTPSQNQPVIPIPSYNIQADFKSRADYILGSDGTVRNQAGALQPMSGVDWNLPGGGKWTWDVGNQKWIHGGPTLPTDKTYYVVGNMEIASNIGTTASPVRVTFIAEGSITVSGNPSVTRYLDNKYAFMAGKDLTVSGNPVSGYSSAGIHYAGDQLKLSGTPRINGVLIAANKFDTNSPGCGCNPVPLVSGRMEISGNIGVHYDGGLLGERARVLSWREVRN